MVLLQQKEVPGLRKSPISSFPRRVTCEKVGRRKNQTYTDASLAYQNARSSTLTDHIYDNTEPAVPIFEKKTNDVRMQTR